MKKITVKALLAFALIVLSLLLYSCGDNKKDAFGKIGDTLSGDTWNITLKKAVSYKKINEDDDLLRYTAGEGKVFAVLFFEIENVSSKDAYFNSLYVSSYADGYKASVTSLLTDVDGYESLRGSVASGKKAKGYISWELDEDFKELTVTYSDGLLEGASKYTFTVTRSDMEQHSETRADQSVSASAVESETATSVASSTDKTGAVPAGPGGTQKGNTWNMTLIKAKSYKTIQNENEFLSSTAKDGKVYVLLFFEAENVSGSTEYMNLFCISSYVDGYKTDNQYLLSDVDDYPNFTGDVEPGKKIKGFVAYEVDENWNKLETVYNCGTLTAPEKYAFKVTRAHTEGKVTGST